MPAKREFLPNTGREEYIKAESRRGISSIALGVKNRYIDEFARYCAEKEIECPQDVSTNHLRGFASNVSMQHVSKSTASVKLTSVLGWLDWCKKHGLISENPAEGMASTEFFQ